MKFNVEIRLEKVDGKDQDQDTLVDALAYQIGEQNGAGENALRVAITDGHGDVESVYVVREVD